MKRPYAYFVVSAIFHYLGPAFAVLLFAYVAPLGVAWLRIVSAAVVFALWRRPWRILRDTSRTDRWLLVALGLTLAGMNAVFYLAIDRLPLATVGAIEFLGPIALAAIGTRGGRNVVALVLAVGGVAVLTRAPSTGDLLGLGLAFVNCALFVAYIVLGKRISGPAGIDRLGLAMLIAAVVAAPLGFADAGVAFARPELLAAAIGVGICSSVIPYVCDQLALARLPRSTFALLLSLLPATATVIGVIVLAQFPTPVELLGVGLVIAGVAVHRERQRHPVGIEHPRRSYARPRTRTGPRSVRWRRSSALFPASAVHWGRSLSWAWRWPSPWWHRRASSPSRSRPRQPAGSTGPH